MKICYMKTHPSVKFSLYLKKAGLASRDMVHLLKNHLTLSRFLLLHFSFYMWSRLDHYWSNVYQQDDRSGYSLKHFIEDQKMSRSYTNIFNVVKGAKENCYQKIFHVMISYRFISLCNLNVRAFQPMILLPTTAHVLDLPLITLVQFSIILYLSIYSGS